MKYLSLIIVALASSFASAAKDSLRASATLKETVHRRANRRERRRRLKGSVPFPIFLEHNGMIIMEAESSPVQDPWLLEGDRNLRGYTGEGYYRMTGNNDSSGPPNGRLRYGLRILTTGTYRFLMHGHKNFGSRGSESNSVYTQIVGYDGEKGDDLRTYLDGKQGTGRSNEWIWGAVHDLDDEGPNPATYTFDTPGIYELQVSGRARNFHLDRLVLYKVDDYDQADVTDLTLAESARLSMAVPDIIPAPTFDAHVAYLSLVDADANKVLAPYIVLREGVTLDLAKLPSELNIVATMGGSETPGSVRFTLNGLRFRTENGAPWALAGDNGRGNFLEWSPRVGNNNRLEVTPYSERDGGGRVGTPCVLIFNVIDSSAFPAPSSPPTTSPSKAPVRASTPTLQILKLSLVDADKDEVIPGYDDLLSGAVLNLLLLPRNLNILAVATTGPGNTPRSVVFDLNGRKRTENNAPWALFGDAGGDFKPWNPIVNTDYTLVVMPFSEKSGGGRAGIPKTITFRTTDRDRPAPPTSKPTDLPTKAPTRGARPNPTAAPTYEPTKSPVASPTKAPVGGGGGDQCVFTGIRYIDCGSPSGGVGAILGGNLWEADMFPHLGGGTQEVPPTQEIANSMGLDLIYRSNRWGPATYLLENLAAGTYKVILHFAELWTGAQEPGQRVFNVNVQGTIVSDLDVVAKSGGLFSAYKLPFDDVEVTADGLLRVFTLPGEIQMPIISGIEVLREFCGPIPTASPTLRATQAPVPAGTDTCTEEGFKFINCGQLAGDLLLGGQLWLSDQYFVGGGIFQVQPVFVINNGGDLSPMYRTHRWGVVDYDVPVPNGLYRVKLHFAEIFHKTQGPNLREFNIWLQDVLVYENVDIYESVGGFTAYTLTQDVAVTQGSIQISTRKGTIEMPNVAGIAIYRLKDCDDNDDSPDPTSSPIAAPTKSPVAAPTPAGPTVTKLYLVNADDNTDIMALTDGMTIVLADLPTDNLNIRAAVSGPVDRVSFNNGRNERTAPYSYFGDSNGDFDSFTPDSGERLTIIATPFGDDNRAGAALEVTITFQ